MSKGISIEVKEGEWWTGSQRNGAREGEFNKLAVESALRRKRVNGRHVAKKMVQEKENSTS